MLPASMPDVTKAQAIALVKWIAAIAAALGLQLSAGVQETIIAGVSFSSGALVLADALLRNGRAKAVAATLSNDLLSAVKMADTHDPSKVVLTIEEYKALIGQHFGSGNIGAAASTGEAEGPTVAVPPPPPAASEPPLTDAERADAATAAAAPAVTSDAAQFHGAGSASAGE